MVDALTAPVEPVVPVAVTQSPTARSAAEPLCVSWYLVDEERSTVVLVVVGVVVEVVPGRKPAEEKPSTTTVLAFTEVTVPLANPKFPNPEGGLPDPLNGRPPEPPEGKVPLVVEPDGRRLPGNALVQEPDELGWLIITVFAVMIPLLEDPETVTQSPAATDEDATVTVLENVVAEVQLTVT